MNSKRESVAIGAFIVGGIIILVSTLLFISGSGLGRDRQTVVMVFDGSVKGLQEGASVALRGVEIGQVTDIKLIFDTDSIDLIMLVEAVITAENIQRRGVGDDRARVVRVGDEGHAVGRVSLQGPGGIACQQVHAAFGECVHPFLIG